MKKTILIIAILTFFISSAICQSSWEVKVTWDDTECDCLGYDENNYFKVTISIYDEANDELVEPSITVTTADATVDNVIISTTNIEGYCGQIHEYTPDFTIRATVWLMETSTNPETVCCTGTEGDEGVTCQELANGYTFDPKIDLN